MYAKKIKIASVIITHNRIDEAKAQMDIIRELWQPKFESVNIYHEYNGEKSWYPKKYKEDFLHYHKPIPHFIGVNHMLNQGIKHVLESDKRYDYIIITSADAWFYDPVKLKNVILACQKKKFQLAASFWGIAGLGTEFFVITPDLAKKVFPLKIIQLMNKLRLLKWTHTKISKIAILETIFTLHVMRALKNPNKIYLIPGRRTVWLTNRFWSPNFYASHHDQNKRKKDILPQIHRILGDKIENMSSLKKFLA